MSISASPSSSPGLSLLGLTRDIPWDLGDSLLNAWILAWDADQLLRFLAGDLGALRNFWNANIFYPEPLTLAYSEHLFAQAVQILPVYALTGNIILSLQPAVSLDVRAVGTRHVPLRARSDRQRARRVCGRPDLRVRAVPRAAVLAPPGDLVAVDAVCALRPATVFRARRRIEGARVAPAPRWSRRTCRTAISCFSSRRSCWRTCSSKSPRANSGRTRACGPSLSVTAIVVTALTLPFLLPYLELRRLGFGPRALNEVKSFSADVFSYWTAPPESRLWGGLIRAYPKAEGDLFPTIAAFCLGLSWRRAAVSRPRGRRRERAGPRHRRRSCTPVVWIIVAAAAVIYGCSCC